MRFVVESFTGETELAAARERAQRAASFGDRITYLRTTYLRSKQTALHHFDARSAADLERAAQKVGLSFRRIVESVESGPRRSLRMLSLIARWRVVACAVVLSIAVVAALLALPTELHRPGP